MNPKVDQFIAKSKQWPKEITKLRSILLKSKLEEDFKWNQPCYSHNGQNVVIIQSFKACLALMFFKGTLLKDSKKLLCDVGPNSQAARRFEFHSVAEINKLAPAIKAYLKEAIALEKSGQKVNFKKKATPLPDELKKTFSKNARLKKAFEALTPGRQRAYLLHFSGAKQSATRQARIDKCVPRILEGKGMNDR